MISRSGNWASFPKEGAHRLRLIEQWLPGGLGRPFLVLDLVGAKERREEEQQKGTVV